ncbi:hypothetical protein V492_06171 [Pseudogymnoascus sp. VKM F-4246]|nr:hypothetical protein V492_06171 [Pseudogymnoascus sp. VKM F-4246]
MTSSIILLQGGTVLYHDDEDHVSALKDTDILVTGNLITKIAKGIEVPADATVIDCNIQSYNFTPEDIFWGQLSGCLEAIDAGTTYVLDHSHGTYTIEHGK